MQNVEVRLEDFLKDLKRINREQYERARQKAESLVAARLGTEPQLADYERKGRKRLELLDILALMVFVAAFAVSSAHIYSYMSAISVTIYGNGLEAPSYTGVPLWLWVGIHRIGYIFLAEASVLLFFVLAVQKRSWRRFVFGLLAVLSQIFILLANSAVEVIWFTNILPAMFTMGIGFHLESIIVEAIERRRFVSERYEKDLELYQAAKRDAKNHPQYIEFLRASVWETILSLKHNRDHWSRVPPRWKVAAADREIAADNEWGDGETIAVWVIEEGDQVPEKRAPSTAKPKAQPVLPAPAPEVVQPPVTVAETSTNFNTGLASGWEPQTTVQSLIVQNIKSLGPEYQINPDRLKRMVARANGTPEDLTELLRAYKLE